MGTTQERTPLDTDVVVVGGGNAGFTAAHAASARGRKVILLERGTRDLAGGNSFFTAGATRITHEGLESLVNLVEPDDRHSRTIVPPYSAEEYTADLEKVTEGRNDPELTEVLVREVTPTMEWLKSIGMRYRLMYERQAYERPDGSFLFWGGLHIGNVDGGEGMIADHTRIAQSNGVDIRYGHRARQLLTDGDQVVGVLAETDKGTVEINAESVILAAGGFEANSKKARGVPRPRLGKRQSSWHTIQRRGHDQSRVRCRCYARRRFQHLPQRSVGRIQP